MPRTLKRLISVAAIVAALPVGLLAASSAKAAVLTLNDTNCAEWVLSTPVNGAQTLTCTSMAAPTCVIAGPASGLTGGTVQLVATCSPGPISNYQWSGPGVTCGSAASCTVLSAVDGNVEYQVVARNSVGDGTAAKKSVAWSATPSAVAPSNCSVSPSKTPVGVGEQLTLTAVCTGGGVPTSYAWVSSNPGVVPVQSTSASNAQTTFTQATGSATITVTASNAGGSATAAQTSVSVQSSTPPPDTGGGPIAACSGFTATKVIDAAVPANGGGQNRYFTNTSGAFSNGTATGFGATEALVVRFTAPASDPYFTISMAETGAGATSQVAYRTMTLSTKPCDFSVPKSGDALYAAERTGLSISVSSGSATQRYNLVPGGKYYINVKNYAFGDQQQCTASKCEVFFTFANPTP